MEIPYTVQARPDTGLWNAKVGIWLFLASEVMLFGGLFSSYIFLRVGADFPWPVHTLTVKWGFINTLVLIFSSVTVLQAWLAIKRRKYGQYQIWMVLTIACALGFMVIKSVEYMDKYHHYGVQLNDGSVIEGHLAEDHATKKKEYYVRFTDVKTVTLASQKNRHGLLGINLPFLTAGADAGFLKFLEGSKPEFTDATILVSGQPEQKAAVTGSITLDSSTIKTLLAEAVAKAVPLDVESKRKSAEAYKDTGKMTQPTFADAFVRLTAIQPLSFAIDGAKIAVYDGSKATFKDGTVIEGKLADDTLNLEADKIDLRRLFDVKKDNVKKAIAASKKADAWKILGDKWKEHFLKHVDEMEKKFSYEKEPMQNGDFVREAFSWKPEEDGLDLHSLVVPGEAHSEHGGSKEDAGAAHEEHPHYPIARKDIHFYSNFLPKYNNFYAIYFALTGLHGLHVLAGVLVLSHFLFFGKKLYLKNPEHLANRVETGGLFWHFVDLIWIFLFPLLYLM